MKRLITLALPSTAAFGALLPGIGVLFPFRIFVLLLFLSSLFSKGQTPLNSLVWRLFLALCYTWIVVAIIGSFFASEYENSTRLILTLTSGLALCVALVKVGPRITTLQHLQTGWIFAFLATAVVAVWELVSGTHLEIFLASAPDYVRRSSNLVGSVFGNPNAYGAFLVTASAFLCKGFLCARTNGTKLYYLTLMLSAGFFTIASGSRLSLFALLLQWLALIVFAARSDWRAFLAAGVAIVLTGLLRGASILNWLTSNLTDKYLNALPSQLIGEVSVAGMSGNARLHLYLDGVWLIWQSGGFGFGPGSFQSILRSGNVPYPTYGTIDPHNLYLEIATQYGVTVLALFLVLICTCLRVAVRAMRRGVGEDRAWGFAVTLMVLGNAIVSLANSTYLTGSVNWVLLATLLVASIMLEGRYADMRGDPERQSGSPRRQPGQSLKTGI